jgi:hypothetical protein
MTIFASATELRWVYDFRANCFKRLSWHVMKRMSACPGRDRSSTADGRFAHFT